MMLRRAAHRAAEQGIAFLATPLLDYQQRHRLTDAELAAQLGVTEADLWRLCLTALPDLWQPGRGWQPEDWEAIVHLFELNPDALRRVLEEMQ